GSYEVMIGAPERDINIKARTGRRIETKTTKGVRQALSQTNPDPQPSSLTSSTSQGAQPAGALSRLRLARRQRDGRDRDPNSLTHPPQACLSTLRASREPVEVHAGPHPSRPLPVERVDAQKPQRPSIRQQQLAEERVEPL